MVAAAKSVAKVASSGLENDDVISLATSTSNSRGLCARPPSYDIASNVQFVEFYHTFVSVLKIVLTILN